MRVLLIDKGLLNELEHKRHVWIFLILVWRAETNLHHSIYASSHIKFELQYELGVA